MWTAGSKQLKYKDYVNIHTTEISVNIISLLLSYTYLYPYIFVSLSLINHTNPKLNTIIGIWPEMGVFNNIVQSVVIHSLHFVYTAKINTVEQWNMSRK